MGKDYAYACILPEVQIYSEICNEYREECNDAKGMEKLGTAEHFQAASVKGKYRV